jgi:uncharacterized membrane protein
MSATVCSSLATDAAAFLFGIYAVGMVLVMVLVVAVVLLVVLVVVVIILCILQVSKGIRPAVQTQISRGRSMSTSRSLYKRGGSSGADGYSNGASRVLAVII